ncbi:zinc finger, CCHC-type containing protein [Tanacetum coccineum]
MAAAMKHMASNFAKLEKFKGVNFRRWQKKMHFLLSSMSVVYVLTTPMPDDGGENPTVEQVRKRAKWDNDDYVCRGLILNGISDSLFDVYQNVETSKKLWDTLKAKYMAEDASSKKFLISNFTNYKMTNSRTVLEQYNELLGILGRFTQHKMNMDESIQLGSHLRIEESLRAQDNDKPKGNNVAGPSVVNMCGKPGHLKKDCKAGNVSNRANGSGINGSEDGSSNPLKVTDEIVQQPEPELRKSKRHRTPKDFGPEFQLYLIEGTRDEDVAFWKEAINDEMDSIMGNNTWVLTDLPPGCRPLGCKWIFKRKLKVDGTVEKFKARLVIQGFKQKSGIDYFDTYAHVIRISTIRLLIAMASIHSMIIHQMDVKTAFLNGELEEEVYMNQPLGFILPSNENKLKNVCIANLMHLVKESSFAYMLMTLIFGTDQVQVDLTKEFLSSMFSMKDMGEADVILGYTDVSWISNTEVNSSASGWVFLLSGAAVSEAEWYRVYTQRSLNTLTRIVVKGILVADELQLPSMRSNPSYEISSAGKLSRVCFSIKPSAVMVGEQLPENVETSKKLWDTLEAKYMADGCSRKMNMDESIQVSCIIDKLPPSSKDFKHTLKHLKEELTLIKLGSHLRIESFRAQDNDTSIKGNNVAGPSVINMMEHNNSSKYNDKKSKQPMDQAQRDQRMVLPTLFKVLVRLVNAWSHSCKETFGERGIDAAWLDEDEAFKEFRLSHTMVILQFWKVTLNDVKAGSATPKTIHLKSGWMYNGSPEPRYVRHNMILAYHVKGVDPIGIKVQLVAEVHRTQLPGGNLKLEFNVKGLNIRG